MRTTRSRLWKRVVAAGAGLLLGLATAGSARANCQVETLELPVRMVGSRATATLGINGVSVPLTVDSGAFYSMLTTAAAAQLNLDTRRNNLRVEGIAGRAETRTAFVDRVQLFKGEIEHVEFIVGGNEPGAGTLGLMGRNILAFTDAEYDLAHGMIRLLFPNPDCAKANMAYWAGTTPVVEVELDTPLRNRTPAIRARVKLNGRETMALFDTGATTLVSTLAARRAGIAEADMTPAGMVYGVGRGQAKAWTAAFDTFELGGETIRGNRLRVADIDLGDAEMLLGIDFFLSHRIYVSKQQSKMFFTYNGGPVFSLDRQAAAGGADAAPPPATDGPAATADELARRGAASASRRDFDRALADLDRACALEPTSAALFAQRAAIQQALKRPGKALEDVDRALELDPRQVDARLLRVVLRSAAANRDGARADLDELDSTIAPQAQMRRTMAQFYLHLDRPARAVAQLDQWLPAHPTEVGREAALNERCWARVLLGIELDRALDDCNDAVDGNPKSPAYLDSRGWAHVRLGSDRKAIADFDRSVELQPRGASALYGRGLAKKRLGDEAGGDVDLVAARKAQPDIEARLARLGLSKTAAGP